MEELFSKVTEELKYAIGVDSRLQPKEKTKLIRESMKKESNELFIWQLQQMILRRGYEV
ncbi:MAG: hypothetical protein ACTSSJ_03985 [Candidatus Odinarchaeia archaeon]